MMKRSDLIYREDAIQIFGPFLNNILSIENGEMIARSLLRSVPGLAPICPKAGKTFDIAIIDEVVSK